MMIKAESKIKILCDMCGREDVREHVSSPEDFTSAWKLLTERGWKAQKLENGVWEHACPGCVNKHLKNQGIGELE